MKFRTLLAPVATLAVAAVLMGPEQAEGFNLLGSSLDLGQRDFRVFNNFTDSGANNNTTPDAQFPGYTGATLAIWKACVEWGSEPHGDGSGDPQQPILGSGGANFDAFFTGNASSVGGSDNIHSELIGSDGGTLAFAQGGSAGWTIRYFSNWNWQDGPGNPSGGVFSNNIDLQGVAAHEYGHALGLDHTNVSGSTMTPSISGNGYTDRSIGSDDINGVRAIYGVASASKPSINSVSIGGGGTTVTVSGSNFSPTNNEVWFSRKAISSSSNGDPIKVTNVNSNGSSITVTIPTGAGRGDIAVRNNGTGFSNLSNAYPFNGEGPDPAGPTINNISPAVVASLSDNNLQNITITGSSLNNTTNVSVDGVPLTAFPAEFTVVDANTITMLMPLQTTLGTKTIELSSPLGPASINIEVVAPTNPVVRAGNAGDPEQIFSFSPLVIRTGGGVGDLEFLIASTLLGTSEIPGLFSLDIANNFTQFVQLGSFANGPAGFNELTLNVSGLPFGTSIYFQTIEVKLSDPGGAPYASSNVAATEFIF